MKRNLLLLLFAMLVSSCINENGDWTFLTLFVWGTLGLLLTWLFAKKTVRDYKEWMKEKRPITGFWNRVRGFFFDWGHSRMEAKSSLQKTSNNKVLMIVELVIATFLFLYPMFVHGGFVLYFMSLVLYGCIYFTFVTSDDNIPAAYIMPLQLYVAIRLSVDLLIIVVSFLWMFLKDSLSSSSSSSMSSRSSSSSSMSLQSISSSNSKPSKGQTYKGISTENPNANKKPYTVAYRYKSGTATHDERQVMYFDKEPTIKDIQKYIRDNGWPINEKEIVVYHIQWGSSLSWGQNLLTGKWR